MGIGRKVVRIIGVLVGLVVAGIVAVFYFSSGMVSTADAFFKAVAVRDMGSARNYLAQDFRAATSEAELQAYLERSAILDYAEAHWSSRQVAVGGTGSLEGNVVTRAHGTIPVKLAFVKESGSWKIYSLQKANAGLTSESSGQPLPSRGEVAQLATQTTLAFARAVNANDLKIFYVGTAREFQQEVTFEKFNAGFGQFVSHHVNLMPVERVPPVLTPDPGMTPNGVLNVEGYFPFTDARVKFAYTYVYRFTGWKLLGINLSIAHS